MQDDSITVVNPLSLAAQSVESPEYVRQQAAELACRTCGVVGEVTVVQPNHGPHKLRADCAACGAYIKFLSPRSPAERRARSDHFRRTEVARRPVTPDQRLKLKALRWKGPMPQDRQAAIDLIDALSKQEEVSQ